MPLGLLVAVSSASDVCGSADAESLSNELNSDRSDVELDMFSTTSSSDPCTMHKRIIGNVLPYLSCLGKFHYLAKLQICAIKTAVSSKQGNAHWRLWKLNKLNDY